MSDFDVLINVLIGVSSGVFSSVIVSVCFFEITNEQNNMNRAKQMIYPIYEMFMISDLHNQKFPNIEQFLERLKYDFEELNSNFSTFEPKYYKGKLKEVLNEFYDYMIDGKNHEIVQCGNCLEIAKDTKKLIDSFAEYENNFTKYCFINIIRNKVIKATIIILILIILLTIIA